jgi:pimeloyl-ACP methyl ester carboxylesterase
MSKRFYSYAIFFTGLVILSGLFQSIVYSQLDARLNELQSLGGWYLFMLVTGLVSALVELKYFRHKQYVFTFWALTVSITASVLYVASVANTFQVREYTVGFIVAAIIFFAARMLYGASLVFSKAGERHWLKAAGVFLVVDAAVSLTFSIWSFSSIDVRLNGTGMRIEQWLTLTGSLIPVFVLINFWRERVVAKGTDTSREESLIAVMGFVAMIAVVSMTIFGGKVAMESLDISRNPSHVPDFFKKIAEPFDARTYVNSHGDTMPYRLLLPLDYDSTRKYPLVVCLHGGSGCGTDNVRQVATSWSAQLLSKQENRTKYPAILFVPQCPPLSSWGGIPNVAAVDSLVFETILALEKEFAIDVDRRYVAGHSLGGYGSWHFICARPEMFAAAIPMAGGGNPELAQQIVSMPVWAFHGSEDLLVPVSGSQDIIEAIKKAGGDPQYTEYPDIGHHIWEKVNETPGLLDWLFAQKRHE